MSRKTSRSVDHEHRQASALAVLGYHLLSLPLMDLACRSVVTTRLEMLSHSLAGSGVSPTQGDHQAPLSALCSLALHPLSSPREVS